MTSKEGRARHCGRGGGNAPARPAAEGSEIAAKVLHFPEAPSPASGNGSDAGVGAPHLEEHGRTGGIDLSEMTRAMPNLLPEVDARSGSVLLRAGCRAGTAA